MVNISNKLDVHVTHVRTRETRVYNIYTHTYGFDAQLQQYD